MPLPHVPAPQPVPPTPVLRPELSWYTPSTPEPPLLLSLAFAVTVAPVVSFAMIVYVFAVATDAI